MNASRSVVRRGLTLLELVVVLLVLSVLASLIVSVVPAMVARAHLAKCADTIPELVKAWTRNYALNVHYPDTCDSLLDPTGTDLSTVLVPGLADQLTPYTLTAADITGLQTVGLTQVVDLRAVNLAAGESATYDSTPNTLPLGPVTPRPLAAGGMLAELNLSAHLAAGNVLNLKRHLNRDGTTNPNVRYVVFGVGPSCSAVGPGRTLLEAPIHFGGNDTLNPDRVYQRYLVVFSLVTQPTGEVVVHFETAAGNDTAGPSSGESHLRQLHREQNASG